MNTLNIARPAVPAPHSHVLDRILAPISAPAAANDTAGTQVSLIVRRRERQRRRDAR